MHQKKQKKIVIIRMENFQLVLRASLVQLCETREVSHLVDEGILAQLQRDLKREFDARVRSKSTRMIVWQWML
jgi:hypothetical protein